MPNGEMMQLLGDWGCDIRGAMDRVLNDQEFYRDCLTQFYHDDSFTTLGEQLQIADIKSAFASAHTLKGVAANLGLTPLYQPLCRIVEVLRADTLDGTADNYAAVLDGRARLGDILGNP